MKQKTVLLDHFGTKWFRTRWQKNYKYLMDYCRVLLFVENNRENRTIIVLSLDFYRILKMEQMINLENSQEEEESYNVSKTQQLQVQLLNIQSNIFILKRKTKKPFSVLKLKWILFNLKQKKIVFGFKTEINFFKRLLLKIILQEFSSNLKTRKIV